MNNGRKRSLEEKQKLRAELDAVIAYNEAELVKMQKQGWDNMTDEQKNLLNNFACVAIETMRLCPPAYVKVAANNLERRIAEFQAKNEALVKEMIEKGRAASEKEEVGGELYDKPEPLKFDYGGTDEEGNTLYGCNEVKDTVPEANNVEL